MLCELQDCRSKSRTMNLEMVQEAKNQLASVVPWRGWSRRALGAPGHRGQRRGSTGRTGAAGGTAGGEEQVGEWRRRGGGRGRRPQRKRTCFSCVFRVVIACPRPSLVFLFFFYENSCEVFPYPFLCRRNNSTIISYFFSLQDTIFFSPI